MSREAVHQVEVERVRAEPAETEGVLMRSLEMEDWSSPLVRASRGRRGAQHPLPWHVTPRAWWLRLRDR